MSERGTMGSRAPCGQGCSATAQPGCGLKCPRFASHCLRVEQQQQTRSVAAPTWRPPAGACRKSTSKH